MGEEESQTKVMRNVGPAIGPDCLYILSCLQIPMYSYAHTTVWGEGCLR